MSGSEITRFKQQQAIEERAAMRGLQSFATVASHKTITARMEQAAPYLVQLLKDGKIEQCEQAVNEMTTELSRMEEEDSSICHTMIIEGKNDA